MSTTRARTAARRQTRTPPTSGALTRAQLRSLEAELRAERARLERSLDAAASVEPVDSLVSASAGSIPGGDADGGLRLALHDRVRARSDAIQAALQRLADGTYGRCAGCGEPIPFGRLLVMPESERCLACAPLA